MFNHSSFSDTAQAVSEVLGIEGKSPSKEEQAAYRRKLTDERASREKQDAQRHRIAAIEAKRVWDTSMPASADHAYLKRKRVKPYGIRQEGDTLIIPVRIGGNITSIQRIKPDGSKLFLKDGEISGGYHSIAGENPAMNRIYIAEGYATGATILEATGCHVVVAFNAGNLSKVAQAIRAKFPDA